MNTKSNAKVKNWNANAIENSEINADQTVDVLYQRMGDRWYAFSMVSGEVFYGSLSDEEIVEAGLTPIQTSHEQKKSC